jgi:hypothetical protein
MNDHEIIKGKLVAVADTATSMILQLEGLDDKSCEEKILSLSEQFVAEGCSRSDALERATFQILTQREKRLNQPAKMSEVDLDDPDVLAKVTARADELEKAGMPAAEALEKAGIEILNPMEERARGWK